MALRLAVRHPNSPAGEAGEVRFEFEQARVVIGRSAGADVRLPGLAVSESHATIERDGASYTVRDEGSTNGTKVNDKALVPRRPRVLAEDDEIAIAEFTIAFSSGSLLRGTTQPERTASLARRMLCELLGSEHIASEPPFVRAMEGAEAGVVLKLGEPPAHLLLGDDEHESEDGPAELRRDLDGTVARALDVRGIDVNGKRVRERRLRHGDVLRAGSQVVLYQDFAEQALRDLEHQPDQPFRELPTLPFVAPEPTPEPAPEPPAPPAPIDSAPPFSHVDLVIYVLALVVLVGSVAGMLWLFR